MESFDLSFLGEKDVVFGNLGCGRALHVANRAAFDQAIAHHKYRYMAISSYIAKQEFLKLIVLKMQEEGYRFFRRHDDLERAIPIDVEQVAQTLKRRMATLKPIFEMPTIPGRCSKNEPAITEVTATLMQKVHDPEFVRQPYAHKRFEEPKDGRNNPDFYSSKQPTSDFQNSFVEFLETSSQLLEIAEKEDDLVPPRKNWKEWVPEIHHDDPKMRKKINPHSPFLHLLILACSAAVKDEQLEQMIKILFEAGLQSPQAIMDFVGQFGGVSQLVDILSVCGRQNQNLRSIWAMTRWALQSFRNGVIPPDVDLCDLMGIVQVKHKVAYLVLSQCFGRDEGIGADRHVLRFTESLLLTLPGDGAAVASAKICSWMLKTRRLRKLIGKINPIFSCVGQLLAEETQEQFLAVVERHDEKLSDQYLAALFNVIRNQYTPCKQLDAVEAAIKATRKKREMERLFKRFPCLHLEAEKKAMLAKREKKRRHDEASQEWESMLRMVEGSNLRGRVVQRRFKSSKIQKKGHIHKKGPDGKYKLREKKRRFTQRKLL